MKNLEKAKRDLDFMLSAPQKCGRIDCFSDSIIYGFCGECKKIGYYEKLREFLDTAEKRGI